MRGRTICALLLCLTAGCYGYRAQNPGSIAAANSFRAAKAQITMTDGHRIRMEQAYVRNDSLVTDHPFRAMPSAVALSDVANVEVGTFSTSRTLLTALAVTCVAYVTLVFFALSNEGT
jgi:hypothetical protein